MPNAQPSRKTFGRRILALALVAAGLVLATVILPSRADPAPTATTTATTPAPSTRAAASLGPKGPLPKARTLQEGLRLTPEEQTILSAVDDRKNQLEEEGMFVMLRRAAGLPRLSPDELDTLGRPTTQWLKEHPDVFRQQPVRMTLIVFKVQNYTLDAKGIKTPWWPKDAPIWELHCLNAGSSAPALEPVIVLSVVDPMPALGKPEKVQPDGTMTWSLPGRTVEVAGVFYKNYAVLGVGEKDHAPEKWANPVIVAWQIDVHRGKEASGWADSKTAIWVGLFLILVFGWLYVRRRASRMRQSEGAGPPPRYRPLRHSMGQEQEEAPEATENAAEVDPELRSAVEKYRKDKRGKDGKDGPG
jgi:hypothetical protein